MIERYNYIDRLKGLAILLVVIGHILVFSTTGNKNPIYTVISSFQMPLFMFLSGLVIKEPKVGKSLFIRVLSLLAPFFVVGLLYNLCIHESLERFFHNEFKHGYWYLLVLTVYYILLLPLRFIRFAQYNFIKDTIIGCVIFVLLKFLDKRVEDDLFSLSLMANLWVYFYIGFLVRRYDGMKIIMKYNLLYTLSILLYFPLLLLYDSEQFVHFVQVVPITAIIFLLYFFASREKKQTKIDSILSWIGKSTLVIYIYHYFILQIINIPSLGNWFIDTHNFFFEIIFLCVLSISI